MKLNKKIYIVKGSEDGNIGVYSNFKKAYEKAVKYIKMGGSQEPKIEYISKSGDLKVKPSTYQGLLRENIKELIGNSIRAEIETHYLNQ